MTAAEMDGAGAAESCPACGEPAGLAGLADSFCESCGAKLTRVSVSDGRNASPGLCPDCAGSAVSADGYCESCGRKVPQGRDHEELDLGVLAGVSDRGLRHHRNEDAMALAVADTPAGPVAVAVVCDGVSSAARPDEASLAAAEAAAGVLISAARAGQDPGDASAAAVGASIEAVTGLLGSADGSGTGAPPRAPGQQHDAPAATLVAAVVDASGATISWLGDSRAYWLQEGPGSSRRLTTDDSVVEQLVAAGLVIDPDAPDIPGAHVVTAWIGADLADAEPHLLRFVPPGPGVLLLCSDGLWNYQPAADHLAAMTLPGLSAGSAGPPGATGLVAAAGKLVTFAISAGGMDNVTVVLIPFPPRANEPVTREIPR